MSLHGAWQTERFARVDRLRAYGHYAKALAQKADTDRHQTASERLATFQTLADSGVPLKITRLK